MNRLIFLLLTVSLLSSCTDSRIIHPSRYQAFLQDTTRIEKEIRKVDQEIDFWEKRLAADTGSFVNMMQIAFQRMHRFKLGGQVADLHMADSLLKISAGKLNNTDPDIYYALSQNSVTLHRFQDAYQYILHADSIGGAAYPVNLLRFDAAMDLGLYQVAEKNLYALKEKDEFDYLIRKARLEDHQGNLDKAIGLMERALQKAEEMKRKSSLLWAKSNLADMYGHAGRIKKASRLYLEVLSEDSTYLYALKGIAWIAYSHDKNPAEAKRILQYILSQTRMPDLYLVLAEIAEWEGAVALKKNYTDQFLQEVEKTGYGDMYNKYLIRVYAEETRQFDKALALAEKEVLARPTPETYDWLAWVLWKKGETEKAGALMKKFVLGKTFEPEAVLHAAFIFTALGEKNKAATCLEECLASSFELGPLAVKEILHQQLN